MSFISRRTNAILTVLVFSSIIVGASTQVIIVSAATDIELMIYTYESLLADPGYNFVEGYSNYSGIPADHIKVVALEDANSLITRLLGEKDNPVADVVIGLDNSLVFEAKQHGLLTPYSSPVLENISVSLIDNLDPEHYLLPYDYGIIAFNYDSLRINTSTVPSLTNLTLNDLIRLDLIKNLVVEDPTLSSPGLGFLLWTIAVFGDPSLNFTGILGEDWRDWWQAAAPDLRVAPSWGAAFDIYYDANENRPIMVSYGTSPAYTVCQGWGDDLKAFLSHENNSANAWLQIEGIALVQNGPHALQGQDFIDWFLGEELQSQIPENNWMYPANTQVQISSCFAEASINPNSVNILNELISPIFLEENLAYWKQTWEETMAGKSPVISSYPNGVIFLITISFSVGLIYFMHRRRTFFSE
ncbi:MAG: thiamine ABC transporter substrate-binding protein [Promethearchaeota archaeon]